MSVPDHSWPCSEDFEVPCSTFRSLRTPTDINEQIAISAMMAPMQGIHKGLGGPDPGADAFLSQQQSQTAGQSSKDQCNAQDSSEAVSDYVARIREAIDQQQQRYSEEQAGEQENETPGLYHVERRSKRMSFLWDMTEKRKDQMTKLKSKSKRLSAAVLGVPTGNAYGTEFEAQESPVPTSQADGKKSKRSSALSGLSEKTKDSISKMKTKGKKVAAAVMGIPLGDAYAPDDDELYTEPPRKTKRRTSELFLPEEDEDLEALVGNDCIEEGQEAENADVASIDEVADNTDIENVPYLAWEAANSPTSSAIPHISIFLSSGPSTTSESQSEVELRAERSPLKKTIEFAKGLAYRGAGSLLYHTTNLLSMQRKWGGWERT